MLDTGGEFIVRRVVDAEQGQAVQWGNDDRAEPRDRAQQRRRPLDRLLPALADRQQRADERPTATSYDLTPTDLLRNLDARAEPADRLPANH